MSDITAQEYRALHWQLPAWLRAVHPLVWLFALAVVAGSWVFEPSGGFDWHNDISRAAQHWWPAPWQQGLPLAPWGAMLLSPLGGLPDRVATALTNGASVVVLALVVRHFGGQSWLANPTAGFALRFLVVSQRPDRLLASGRTVVFQGRQCFKTTSGS